MKMGRYSASSVLESWPVERKREHHSLVLSESKLFDMRCSLDNASDLERWGKPTVFV